MADHAHHADERNGSRARPLAIALGITLAFLIVEVIGGLVTGSLALLADAGVVAYQQWLDEQAVSLAAAIREAVPDADILVTNNAGPRPGALADWDAAALAKAIRTITAASADTAKADGDPLPPLMPG